MADEIKTPLLDELKELCGSDKLHHCFKFLFGHEHTATEAFIRNIAECCNELETIIEQRTARMTEVWLLDHDDEEAAWQIYECLRLDQVRERKRLEVLTALLFEVRGGLSEKEEHIGIMEGFY